jgi:hypothetical protein
LVIKKVHRKIELARYLPARIGKKTPTKDATRRTLWSEPSRQANASLPTKLARKTSQTHNKETMCRSRS